MENFLITIATFLVVAILATIAGSVIRHYQLSSWQFDLMTILGIALLLLGGGPSTATGVFGIVLSVIGGAGAVYFHFIHGTLGEQTQVAQQDRKQKDELHKQIRQRMNERSTEELLNTWQENNREDWTDEAFDAIREILIERGENIPAQNEK